MTERRILEQLKIMLMDMGYPISSLKAEVRTVYGKSIDLVAYENDKPRIVFELKPDMKLPSSVKDGDLGFHPTVRQAQALAQEIGAPYFAVSDGNTILWFDVDKEQGRPRLLQTPILPSIQEQKKASIDDGKILILRVLFSLADIGRGYFELQESMTHVGMAVLARLWSEIGDRKLESFLLEPSPKSQFVDDGLSDLAIAQDERSLDFYSEAFLILDKVQLSKIPPDDFIDALNDLVQFYISRDKGGTFKLPVWISELMANLGQIDADDEILDIYSNFGDGVAAVNKTNDRAQVFSIASNPISYLWDILKRVLLGLDIEDVIRINALNEYARQTNRFAGQHDQVLVAPPFGIRLKEDGFSGRSEDLFLGLALDWVRPGGRVVAIMPENLLFSASQERIRRYVMEYAWVRAIISLEQFMPGTSVKASIIVLDKRSPDNHAGRVMMCRILDQDIRDSSQPSMPILSNNRIQEILEIYNAHVQNEPVPNEKGVWFIPFENLDINSWAVRYYDPETEFAMNSQYPVLHLKELAKLRKGSSLTLDDNGPLLVIGPGAVRALSIDPTKLDRTTQERLPSKPVVAKINDVLIHAVGQYRGQAAVVEPDLENYFISRNIIIASSISPQILPAFLAITLNSTFVKKQLEVRTTGSSIPQLSISKLKDLRIPVPDLSTQRSIVEQVVDTRRRLVEIEQQALVIESALKEQQKNLQSILDNIHVGGGEDA